jgi:hypothetical protein
LFKGFSKLLICGGYDPDTDTCEVINLSSSASTCQNPPNFPAKVYAAIGGLGFKGNPIICGGYQNDDHSNKCYSLKNNEWVSSESMSLKINPTNVQSACHGDSGGPVLKFVPIINDVDEQSRFVQIGNCL